MKYLLFISTLPISLVMFHPRFLQERCGKLQLLSTELERTVNAPLVGPKIVLRNYIDFVEKRNDAGIDENYYKFFIFFTKLSTL